MGWSPGDDREILSKEELVKEFTLDRVNKTSATFGIDKLNWLNGQYIKEKDSKELLKLLIPFLKEKNIIGEDFDREKLLNLVELYKIRMKTLSDFTGHIAVFYSDKVHFDEKGVEKYLKKEGARRLLEVWRDRLVTLDSFDKNILEENCRNLAQELGVKPAELIHPTRVAITGLTTGAGLFETMEVMGRDTVVKRLDYAINTLAG